MKKVFTESEAAKQMLVGASTLATWRRKGYIRYYRRLGRLIRYTPDDIERNLEERSSMRPRPVDSNERRLQEARFG